ncbi:hypothetical protein ACSBR1_013060 [Camellia fascicularis]
MFDSKDTWEKFNSSWNLLVFSSSEDEYHEHLSTLHKEFSAYPEALDYVTQIWLKQYKEKFVASWTNSCMHYRNATTNRAESAHSSLKKQLESSQGSFETCWSKIHNLLELQHTAIKASFQKSLIVVQHNFTPSEFVQLWGNVSLCALEHILAETKRAESIGIDSSACGCVIRHTHGLPCAHEIAYYIRQLLPIPLETLTCIPEVELVIKKFFSSETSMRLEILKKLREIVSPDSTFLTKPKLKPNPRPRGHRKVNVSTRHNPCAFELAESRHGNASTQSHSQKGTQEFVYQTRQVQHSIYIDAFPQCITPYIKHVKDVSPDGHCGCRSIASLIGRGEDHWVEVRHDLLQELHTYNDLYTKLYGSFKRIEVLAHSLTCFDAKPARTEYWMTMLDMGHLIASSYNIVLYHFSAQQCLTFLPLRSDPLPPLDCTEISIGFHERKHFVELFMEQDHPIPPIVSNW